jgi:hypothetical protein
LTANIEAQGFPRFGSLTSHFGTLINFFGASDLELIAARNLGLREGGGNNFNGRCIWQTRGELEKEYFILIALHGERGQDPRGYVVAYWCGLAGVLTLLLNENLLMQTQYQHNRHRH